MLALAVVEAVGRWQALVATKELCGAQLSYEDTGLHPAMVLDTLTFRWHLSRTTPFTKIIICWLLGHMNSLVLF